MYFCQPKSSKIFLVKVKVIRGLYAFQGDIIKNHTWTKYTNKVFLIEQKREGTCIISKIISVH